MPILDIELVLQPDEVLRDDLVQKLADRLGQVFGSEPGQTWVRLRPLLAAHYAENESQADLYPVFVTVLKARRPSPVQMQAEVDEITTAVAQICNRPPENVHILYLPEAARRMAFGGKIVADQNH